MCIESGITPHVAGAEGSFSAMKREHNLSRIPKRGILADTEECLVSAMALNLKRLIKSLCFVLYYAIRCKNRNLSSPNYCFVNSSIIFRELVLISEYKGQPCN